MGDAGNLDQAIGLYQFALDAIARGFGAGEVLGIDRVERGVVGKISQEDVLHVGDAAAQTRHVLEVIKVTLAAAGATMADVAMNHIFLKDLADYAAFNTVYAEYFPGAKPARYCIKCDLVKPECLVEIASVAHIG